VRVVRDRGDARWLPSRFHFALFKLFAYFRLRIAKPEPRPGVVMTIDPHQSALENYIVAVSVLLVTTCFTASLFAASMPFGAACIVAIPVTAVMIHVPIVFFGTVISPMIRRVTGLSDEGAIAINSAILMTVTIAAATMLAAGASPLRGIGTLFLLLAGANAIAAVAVFMMPSAMAAAETRFGVEG
jgi:hypothetical protein